MGESPEPEPGRPRKNLRGEIIRVLETTDHRAMTLGMITEEVDGARATVKGRIDSLVADDIVEKDKIGNATAYWIPDPEPQVSTPAGGGGGGPPDTDDETTPTAASPGFKQRAREMSLPGALVLLILAVIGWETYKAARNAVTGGDPILNMDSWALDLRGVLYLGFLGGGVVAITSYMAWLVMSLYEAAISGVPKLAFVYLTGVVGLLVVLGYADGLLGAPANVVLWIVRGDGIND